MLHDRDVVIVSSIDWDWKWQGPQEIAVRFARAGNKVLFIENPGVRSPRSSDAGRMLKRVVNIGKALRSSVRRIDEGITVCSPLVLPPFGSKRKRAVNRWLLRFTVGRTIRRQHLERPVVILCLPTDVSRAMAKLAASTCSVLIYYAISDLLIMTDHPRDMAEVEREIIAESDLVFTTYLPLVERYGAPGSNVHLLPYGVDTKRFSVAGPIRRVVTEGKVIGYVGGISQHLDVALVNEMARARPDWTFVLIGPLQSGGEGIEELPNIHLPGLVPHVELPEWVRGFDVCVIPYRHSPYTDTVYPVKLNEYLALARPVVSVDLPSLIDHEEKGVLWLSRSEPASFIEKIEEALLVEADDRLRVRRREVAERHDWERRIERMSELIEDCTRGSAPR